MTDRLRTRALFRRAVLIVMNDRVGHPEQRRAQFLAAGAVAPSPTLRTWQERDPITGRRTSK